MPQPSVRRRGLAGDVEQIHRRLKLAGPHRATLVLTRVNDKPWGLICVEPGSAERPACTPLLAPPVLLVA